MKKFVLLWVRLKFGGAFKIEENIAKITFFAFYIVVHVAWSILVILHAFHAEFEPTLMPLPVFARCSLNNILYNEFVSIN
jgi:hypothetical protein